MTRVFPKGEAAAGRQEAGRPPQPSAGAVSLNSDKAEEKMPGATGKGESGAGPVTSQEVAAGGSREGGRAIEKLDAETRVGFSGPNGGRDKMSDDETGELPSHATFYVAHAIANDVLVRLAVSLAAELAMPGPLDAELPGSERLRRTLENFALAADWSAAPIAETLPKLGPYDAAEAESIAAEIVGDTLHLLRTRLL